LEKFLHVRLPLSHVLHAALAIIAIVVVIVVGR
jgi:hypothetical protein